MRKRTIVIWVAVVVVIIGCMIKLAGVGAEPVVYESEEEFVPNFDIVSDTRPIYQVNIITKDEEVPPAKTPIDKTVPKFSVEAGEASYDIYSNDLTRIPADASGEYFHYTFKDENEITVYLQSKEDMLPFTEMEANYANADFCKENNIQIFDKQKIADGVLYLLSYSGSEAPDVVEIWSENEKSILTIYYVNYDGTMDDKTIEAIKDFYNHIEDTTAKG